MWWQIVEAFDDFTKNRQQTIASSNVITIDESMSAYAPQTEKTGNIPHLSYVFRKPKPLGTEAKDTLCTETECILALSLCRAKNDTQATEFDECTQKKIARVTLKLMKSTMHLPDDNPASQGNVNLDATPNVFLGDAWFSSVELCILAWTKLRVHYIGVVKTNSGRYPKEFLQTTMKEWPAGSHLVLKTTIEGTTLYAVGYKYCNRKTLMFIFTEGAGHTEPGAPYIAKWRDNNHNPCTKPIDRPSVISFYFKRSNGIDVHNQQRQKELRLEECWVTTDGYFRIITTLFGMTVVDSWRGYLHHTHPNHRHHKMELLDFVDCLTFDLLHNKMPLQPSLRDSHSLSTSHDSTSDSLMTPPPVQQVSLVNRLLGSAGSTISELSRPELSRPSLDNPSNQLPSTMGFLTDVMEELKSHEMKSTEKREKDTRMKCGYRLKRSVCTFEKCKKKTSVYCPTCVVPETNRVRDHYWVCSDHNAQHLQDVRATLGGRTMLCYSLR